MVRFRYHRRKNRIQMVFVGFHIRIRGGLHSRSESKRQGSQGAFRRRPRRLFERGSLRGLQIHGQGMRHRPCLLLVACSQGFSGRSRHLAPKFGLGHGMGVADRRDLSFEQFEAGSSGPARKVCRARRQTATRGERNGRQDDQGTEERKNAPCLQKGSRQPRRPLGRTDGLRRQARNPNGQQQSGKTDSRSGGRPQKLLRFRLRVDRSIGRRTVQHFSDTGYFRLESQTLARIVSSRMRGKRRQCSREH